MKTHGCFNNNGPYYIETLHFFLFFSFLTIRQMETEYSMIIMMHRERASLHCALQSHANIVHTQHNETNCEKLLMNSRRYENKMLG